MKFADLSPCKSGGCHYIKATFGLYLTDQLRLTDDRYEAPPFHKFPRGASSYDECLYD